MIYLAMNTDYIARSIDSVLIDWSRGIDRKPLILRGARQTGKTAAVRQFASRFGLLIELNLERFEDLSLVRSCRSADELLTALSARHNLSRFPQRTLLFLDEIQESPEAINWLRFFREDHPQLFVIAAGSLLEVRMREQGFQFPVGRVTFRLLRPFTFFEFLAATGRQVLADHLLEALQQGQPAPVPLHEQALSLLREYILVGGMPEAVRSWVDQQSPQAVRRIHRDLIQALAEDLQKYKTPRVSYLEAAFGNLQHHYGLRFRYENFVPGYRSQMMNAALSQLEAALLISRVWPTSSLTLPLRTRPRSAPKLLPLDIGLALHSMGWDFERIRSQPLEQLLEGRIAEMFAGLQLLASRASDLGQLHFWVAESSRSNAETDFLLAGAGSPMPVEVKSGASGTLKSLHQFLWRANLNRGVRLHCGPYSDEEHTVKMPDGEVDYRLLSLPLYMTEHLPLELP